MTFNIIDEQSKKILKGEIIKDLPDSTKENYEFIGWYLNDVKFDFNTKITQDITQDIPNVAPENNSQQMQTGTATSIYTAPNGKIDAEINIK